MSEFKLCQLYLYSLLFVFVMYRSCFDSLIFSPPCYRSLAMFTGPNTLTVFPRSFLLRSETLAMITTCLTSTEILIFSREPPCIDFIVCWEEWSDWLSYLSLVKDSSRLQALSLEVSVLYLMKLLFIYTKVKQESQYVLTLYCFVL